MPPSEVPQETTTPKPAMTPEVKAMAEFQKRVLARESNPPIDSEVADCLHKFVEHSAHPLFGICDDCRSMVRMNQETHLWESLPKSAVTVDVAALTASMKSPIQTRTHIIKFKVPSTSFDSEKKTESIYIDASKWTVKISPNGVAFLNNQGEQEMFYGSWISLKYLTIP